MNLKYNMIFHTVLLTIISIILFTIYTISNQTLDNSKSSLIYIIGMSLYGVFILLNFYFHENSFYGISAFCMTFLFCEKGFYNFENISLLSNLFMFTILGFIIHLIKYKPKLYISHYSLSTFIFIFTLSLSGLGVKEYDPNYPVYNPWYMPFLVIIVGLLILFLLNYFECSNKSTLEDVSIYFKSFVILIGYEILFYVFYKLNGNFQEFFKCKTIFIGIGHPNTVAIILQLTLPFMLYFSFKRNNFINTVFFYLNFLLIVLTMSRGAILVSTILMVGYIIYLLIKNRKNAHINLLCHLSVFVFFLVIILCLFIKNKETCILFLKNLFSNIKHLNGREFLWEYVFNHWYYNPIFGIGIFSNSYWKPEIWDTFQFAHSTFFHTLWMAGIVGFIGLCIHLLDKYIFVIKSKKDISLMLMFYLCSGLYGTFDVTYYNLHFTTYLLVIMFLYSSVVYKSKHYTLSSNYLF